MLRKKRKSIIAAVLIFSIMTAVLTCSSLAAIRRPGDADGNGEVNSKDVLLMRKSLANWKVTIDKSLADANQDDKFDPKDVLLVRKGLAKWFDINSLTFKATTAAPTTAAPTTVEPTTAPGKAIPDLGLTSLGENKKAVGSSLRSPISGDEYKLVWIDDFNLSRLSSRYWNVSEKNANQMEESVNRAENVTVENGMLKIAAKREDKTYTGDADSWNTPKTSNLTSGLINTQGKKSFQYGRIEIKCKIPRSYGMWAAFWTMGTKRGWPWGGEVDIMEFVGGNKYGKNRDKEYLSCLHWADPNVPSSIAWSKSTTVKSDSPDELWNSTETKLTHENIYTADSGILNDEWRICGVEWDEKKMSFYCNDKVFATVDITRNSMREAYHQPHYLILNLVMGGDWAGTPNENTIFPQYLMVDWVKVWQK